MAFSGFDTNALQPTPLRTSNPLEMAGQAAQIKNALLANQVQQAEFDAQKAQGAAYAHHYNALTGKYDMPAVQAEMGASEAGQLGLPDAITRVRSQQSQQIGNDAQQLQLSQRRAGMIAGIAAPYLQKPDLTKTDLAPAYGTAIAHGLMSLEQANQSYASLPAGGDALKQQVRGLMDSSIGPEHSYQDAYGTTQLVDDGGVLRWQNVSSPASGQGGRDVGAPIAKQTSPDFNSSPMDVVNPDGSHSYVRRDQIVGTGGGRPTVPSEAMGSGRYPSQQAGNPGYQAAPAAGQTEAIAATAKAGAEGANALMQASANRNDRMAMLGNMASDLEGFNSGPGYENLRKAEQLFNVVSPIQINSSGIESAQSFNKWAQNLANAQSQALGAGTDSKLAAAVHASPNSSLQSGTNRLMIHQLQGNEDAINAKAQAWKSSGLQPAQFQQWNQQFSQSFDPRAFQMIRMSPAERTTYIDGLKKSGQFDELKKNYNAMAAAGLVPDGR